MLRHQARRHEMSLILLGLVFTASAYGQQTCTQVTIKNGDTLSNIAALYGSTVNDILSVNPSITNANLIQVGQQINIPCARDVSASPSPAPAPGAAACGSYVIRGGDSLYSIGAMYGTTIGALLAANPTITDPALIVVGDRIALPCVGAQTVTITPEQFNQSLTVNNYTGQNDTVRQDMLNSISAFGNNTVIASSTELAMYLSQAIHETGGLAKLKEVNGSNQSYAPYYGRGYIQLTGRQNYQQASLAIFNNASVLLNNPDMILTNDSLAWGVSTWFWKVNVHSRPGISNGSFGVSTNAINSMECNSTGNAAATHRCNIYKNVLPILVPNAVANCSGCG